MRDGNDVIDFDSSVAHAGPIAATPKDMGEFFNLCQ